ncbi:WYL domain-containing protein [Cupriavidus sp. DL-D2]|jgi:predicted DNA-binding transcriptional regulator YafY|uniref:helix-turn-helix transcriptional regulator n=1 Tax=Cupriavidus sp. DL-D2 TaxID=3144974 RepID=UPI0032128972
MTTPQVADALERSGQTVRHVKTVQRRLEALLEAGVVVKRKAGNTLEWQKKEGASGVAAKAGTMMTFDEALALQTLKRFAGRQIPTLVGAALGGLFEVAEDRLKQGATPDGRRHASWHRKVAAVDNGFHLLAPTVKEAIFFAVSEALFSEQLLEIVYKPRSNPEKKPQPQEVMPLGLVEMASFVYLVAKRGSKPEPAMYRLDRMESARVCPEPFPYPKDFSLEKYIAQERQFDFLPRGEIKLAVRFTNGRSHAVCEAPISQDQTVEHYPDGSIIVRGTVKLSERLHWWLRSFGPFAEVLEPTHLRDEFAAESRAAAKLYARGR